MVLQKSPRISPFHGKGFHGVFTSCARPDRGDHEDDHEEDTDADAEAALVVAIPVDVPVAPEVRGRKVGNGRGAVTKIQGLRNHEIRISPVQPGYLL